MEEAKPLLESLFSEEDDSDDVFKLCDIVRETSYSIHKYLRHGHLESVYERALAHRLTKLGFSVQQQVALPVYDEDGTELGVFYADLVVNDCLVVEIKASVHSLTSILHSCSATCARRESSTVY